MSILKSLRTLEARIYLKLDIALLTLKKWKEWVLKLHHLNKMINSLEELRRYKAQGKCPNCKKDMSKEKFKDEISVKEFKISGLCQVCQDEIFDEITDD